MLPRQIAEASSKDELASFCFVVELIWFKTNVKCFFQHKKFTVSLKKESFSDCTSQSKAALSALLSAADADAFSIP